MSCRERALNGLDRLPPFSPILNRLLATVAKEDVSFAKLAGLIEQDAVLAGNVLRLVNSALYSLPGTVNSVRHAVAILGVNRLRNVALGLSVSRAWGAVRTPPGWSPARFNLHSIATGILADSIAQRTEVPYPEGGFVAGLLHDLGKLLIAIVLPAEYEAIQARAPRGDVTDAEKEVIDATHAELSGMVLKRWNLPLPIQQAARYHHEPDLSSMLRQIESVAGMLSARNATHAKTTATNVMKRSGIRTRLNFSNPDVRPGTLRAARPKARSAKPRRARGRRAAS